MTNLREVKITTFEQLETPPVKKLPMEFVFATHNEHKLEEIRALLPKNIMLKSLSRAGL